MVLSKIHSSTRFSASQTRAARARHDRRVKVALMRDAAQEFKKRAKVKPIRGLRGVGCVGGTRYNYSSASSHFEG